MTPLEQILLSTSPMIKRTSTISECTAEMDFMRKNPQFFSKFMVVICELKSISDCKMYDYKKCPDEIMGAILSEKIFTITMKLLSTPESFILYGIFGVEFFSVPELK